MIMKLSIIIPAYNEEKTIEAILEKVKKVNIGKIKKEIIIVDDGSKDRTREILKKLKGVTVIFHTRNGGKGCAIRTGIKRATGDLIIVQDADLEYDPNDYPKLLEVLLSGKTDVVYGSRFLDKHNPKYKLYYLGNKFLSLMTSILYNQKITDMETCYKLFRANVLKELPLRATRFDFEPEVTAKVIKRGHHIIEVPIWYQCRDFEEGKKITWRDGVKAVWYLLRYRIAD
jgi:glycosyltransferase involved in cell wall biosynthesis